MLVNKHCKLLLKFVNLLWTRKLTIFYKQIIKFSINYHLAAYKKSNSIQFINDAATNSIFQEKMFKLHNEVYLFVCLFSN